MIASGGLLSRKRFLVRPGMCEELGRRGEKKPRLAVSIALMASKLKLLARGGNARAELKELRCESDRLRLMTIFTDQCIDNLGVTMLEISVFSSKETTRTLSRLLE